MLNIHFLELDESFLLWDRNAHTNVSESIGTSINPRQFSTSQTLPTFLDNNYDENKFVRLKFISALWFCVAICCLKSLEVDKEEWNDTAGDFQHGFVDNAKKGEVWRLKEGNTISQKCERSLQSSTLKIRDRYDPI